MADVTKYGGGGSSTSAEYDAASTDHVDQLMADTAYQLAWIKSLKNDIDNVDPLPSGSPGDILVHDATDWDTVNIGTSGYILQSNGSTADWEFVVPDAEDGYMLVGNASDQWEVLEPGTDGYVLTGTGTGVAWEKVDLGLTTTGVVYWNGTALTTIANGLNGDYFKMVGGAPDWTG